MIPIGFSPKILCWTGPRDGILPNDFLLVFGQAPATGNFWAIGTGVRSTARSD